MWRSQTILLALIRKGLTREKAYELTQRNAMQTWQAKHEGDTQADFRKQLESDPEIAEVLSKEELNELCDVDFHFRNIDYRFKQLGIEP
jgi:adenylosuccinate lyase